MNLPVVSTAEMRSAEEAAFALGITAEALMEEAGAGIARAVRRFVPVPGRCVVFAGKGNNAGDAIVAALHLQAHGWEVVLHLAFKESDGSELLRKKLRLLECDRGLRAAAIGAPGPVPCWLTQVESIFRQLTYFPGTEERNRLLLQSSSPSLHS